VERSLNRIAAEGKEKRIVVRLHPEVALQILEQEANFLPTVRKRTGMKVELLDDPLMRQDEYRLLAGPAETDVTERYVAG
jgi:ribonuclease G